VFVTHAAKLAPKSSQGKRAQLVEPPVPKQHEGSRLLGLVARLSLRMGEIPVFPEQPHDNEPRQTARRWKQWAGL
jgi:hypothetical protein